MNRHQKLAQRPSLRHYILSRIAPVTILFLLVLAVATSQYVSSVVRSGIQTRVDQAAVQAGEEVSINLSLVAEACRAVAQNDVVVNGIVDIEHRSSVTRSFLESLRLPGAATQSITMTDYRGRYLAGSNRSVDYEKVDWFDNVIKGHDVIVTDGDSITIAVPVRYGGRPEGMVAGNLSLAEFLSNVSMGPSQAIAYEFDDSDHRVVKPRTCSRWF